MVVTLGTAQPPEFRVQVVVVVGHGRGAPVGERDSSHRAVINIREEQLVRAERRHLVRPAEPRGGARAVAPVLVLVDVARDERARALFRSQAVDGHARVIGGGVAHDVQVAILRRRLPEVGVVEAARGLAR